ncbi:MAG: acyl-CoA dehydrogenase family protein, partial [Limnohabitans sp.]
MTDLQDKTMPICGDDYPLTEKQQQLMALARQLGRDNFAPRAAQLDREAQFPFANYDDLREAGLLGQLPHGVAGPRGAHGRRSRKCRGGQR